MTSGSGTARDAADVVCRSFGPPTRITAVERYLGPSVSLDAHGRGIISRGLDVIAPDARQVERIGLP